MLMIILDNAYAINIMNGIQTLKFVGFNAIQIVKTIVQDQLLEGAKNVLMVISKYKTFVYLSARMDIQKV